MQNNLLFTHIRRDGPLFGTNEASFLQPGMKGVELVNEDLVD